MAALGSLLDHADLRDEILSYLSRKDLLCLAAVAKKMSRAMEVLWQNVDEKMLRSLVRALVEEPLGDQTALARVKWYCERTVKIELGTYTRRETSKLYDDLTTLAYALALQPFPRLRSVFVEVTDPRGLLLATRVVGPTVTRIHLALCEKRNTHDREEWRECFAEAIKHVYTHCKDIAYLAVTGTATFALDDKTMAALKQFKARSSLKRVSLAIECCLQSVFEALQEHPAIERLDFEGSILPSSGFAYFSGAQTLLPWANLKHLTLDMRARAAILLLESLNAHLKTLDAALTFRCLQDEYEELTQVLGKKYASVVELRIAVHPYYPTSSDDELDFGKATAPLQKCNQLVRLAFHHYAMQPLLVEEQALENLIRHMMYLGRLELLWSATYLKLKKTERRGYNLDQGISLETLSNLIHLCPTLRSMRLTGITWDLPLTIHKSNRGFVVQATWVSGNPVVLARIWRRAWPDLRLVIDSNALAAKIIRLARLELALGS